MNLNKVGLWTLVFVLIQSVQGQMGIEGALGASDHNPRTKQAGSSKFGISIGLSELHAGPKPDPKGGGRSKAKQAAFNVKVGRVVILDLVADALAGVLPLAESPAGILVGAMAQNHTLAKMGLQEGDIIVSVNGVTMSRSMKFGEAHRKKNSGYWVLVKRGNYLVSGNIVVQNGRAAPKLRLTNRGESLARGASPPEGGTDSQGTGIRKIGKNHYKLNEKAKADLLDAEKLVAGARIMPNIDEGKVNGFKITAIQSDSIIGQLGFEDGDVLVSINGIAMKTPDAVLGALDALKKAKTFRIKLIRGTKNVLLRIDLP